MPHYDKFTGATGADAISTFPDGAYRFEITKAAARDAGTALVIDLTMEPIWGPEDFPQKEIKQSNWIKDADSANQFMRVLNKVGFDTDRWSEDGTQEKMVPIAIRYMAGMRVECTKKANHSAKDNKTYHNVYINGRAKGAEFGDGKPEKIDNEELLAWNEDNPDLSGNAEGVSF